MYKYAVGPESASNVDVLTEEEVSLTSQLLSAVSAGELLTKMSPVEASRRTSDVREILLLGNLRLVAHEARIRAYGGFLAFDDLFQIGTIGLMTAMEKFDPFRGFQFSTYATHWIRQAISREQANLDRSIRLPVHVVEELNSLLQRRTRLESDLNRSVTNVELANELGLRLDRVEFLLQLAHAPASLNLLIEEGAGAVEKELMLHETEDSDERMNLSNRIVGDVVERVLSSLSSREAQVIKFRFGIGGGNPQTLEQVGQHFGVTRERIRQIEAKALKKTSGAQDCVPTARPFACVRIEGARRLQSVGNVDLEFERLQASHGYLMPGQPPAGSHRRPLSIPEDALDNKHVPVGIVSGNFHGRRFKIGLRRLPTVVNKQLPRVGRVDAIKYPEVGPGNRTGS